MKRLWELILLVIVIAVMIEHFEAYIQQHIAAIIVASLILLILLAGGLIGVYAYRRNRNW